MVDVDALQSCSRGVAAGLYDGGMHGMILYGSAIVFHSATDSVDRERERERERERMKPHDLRGKSNDLSDETFWRDNLVRFSIIVSTVGLYAIHGGWSVLALRVVRSRALIPKPTSFY